VSNAAVIGAQNGFYWARGLLAPDSIQRKWAQAAADGDLRSLLLLSKTSPQCANRLFSKSRHKNPLSSQAATSPLETAIAAAQIDAVKFLIPLTDMKRLASLGQHPLFEAVWLLDGYASAKIIALLLPVLDPRAANDKGETPLHYAAQGRNAVAALALLDDSRVSVDAVDQNGETPLSQAARNGLADFVAAMLPRANPTTRAGAFDAARQAFQQSGYAEGMGYARQVRFHPVEILNALAPHAPRDTVDAFLAELGDKAPRLMPAAFARNEADALRAHIAIQSHQNAAPGLPAQSGANDGADGSPRSQRLSKRRL